MVNLIRAATGILAGSLLSANAATLSVTLDEPRVELGRGLNVEIVYTGDKQVDQANLQRWQKDFYIDRRRSSSEQLNGANLTTIETVRLYPRRKGDLTLYSLALGGAISEPIELSIEPPLRNGINGTPSWQALPQQVWQGETLSNCVEMALFDARNNMKMETPEIDAFRVAPHNAELIESATGPRAHQCWQLTALRPGFHELELPPVIQRGRGSWSFYLPTQTLEVLPLPSYLPPALPVGQPKLQATLSKDHWQLHLQLNDPEATEAYGVRSALAKVSGVDSDEVRVQLKTDSQTLMQHQTFTAPLPTWVWGWSFGSGRNISVRYFDTEMGMLKSTEISLPPVWRVPAWFTALFVSLMLLGALLLGRIALRFWRQKRTQLELKRAIRSCTTPEQLRHLLLQQASSGKTLNSWADQSGIEQAHKIATELNALCFSPNSGSSFDRVKTKLLAAF